ncbi:ATP-binding protein [Chryseolinea lacunae]|uniref:histidine kinase n=1 Tax=Chryseolinea lacunae TaxID=2801331 RepID=A0ABS1KS34_9BACT|nr:ATP-binding protein [Chryseolinea lacunae]MBL0742003.1 GHKL domain-containing protein [Chryseolinea lacunae]
MLTKEEIFSQLKMVPEFKNLPPGDLMWLAERGATEEYADGTKIFKAGDPMEELRILFKGAVDFYLEQNGSLQFYDVMEPYEMTGRLPYSRMKGAAGHGIARGVTVSFQLHSRHFQELVRDHYGLTEVLVHAMTDRVREFTRVQQQNDKMVALGKLSAGLAHELNNPSAAVVRGAQELKKHLSNLPKHFKGVIKIKATDEIVDTVNDLVVAKINSPQALLSLSSKTEKEDALLAWLEDNGIEDAYLMTETFSDFGFTLDDFEKLGTILRPEDKNAVINWLHQVLTTERLVHEIEEASRRINNLVSSIKSYTHMDQAPEKEPADVHEGIKSTVMVLNHKFKKNRVQLVCKFADVLPKAKIYVSSMNQVWMNIIDNALDALEGQEDGKIEIQTEVDREFIVVTITDNGPGVPKEIQDKIFDAFYTTKAIGKGTGLGLEMVRQIIHRHKGDVKLKSEPGRTSFEVCFPIG